MPEEKKIVFSDAFYPEGWSDFFREDRFRGIVPDTHRYLTMVEYGFGQDRPLEKYLGYLAGLKNDIGKTAKEVPVFVGEWSLSNVMTGCENDRDAALKELGASYLEAVSGGLGWFYWNWKVESGAPGMDLRDFRTCSDKGWI